MAKPVPELILYFLDDILGGDPCYTYRSMFGGYGIYKDGKIFSIFAYNQLYFKVGPDNLQDYLDHGSEAFVYTKK